MSLTILGKRGPKPRRPDPIVAVNEAGDTHLFCPIDEASLIRLHTEYGRDFFACTARCGYCLDGRRARKLKAAIYQFLAR